MRQRLIGGRFELQEEVASGGMGKVYRALDRRTKEVVAVKILHRGAAAESERFVREAELLASVAHPAIVRHVAEGTTGGDAHFLAMEWLDGVTLRQHLDQIGVDLDESVRLMRAIAGALAAVHAQGIIHRDIKPTNIFLVGGAIENVKLIDFGIARSLSAMERLTRTGTTVGTPSYMAPELVRGDRDVDARVDVFACGCVLYECVTGKPAFVADTDRAVFAKILLRDPPPVARLRPDLSPQLATLVDRMLAKERNARPRDGGELLRLLGSIKEQAASRRRTGEPEPATAVGRRGDAGERVSSAAWLVFGTVEEQEQLPLEDTAAKFAATASRSADGTFHMRLEADGPPGECAARAARCALELRARAAKMPLTIVAAPAPRDDVDAAIERGYRLLQAAAVDVAFGRAPGAAIHLDEATARLLSSAFAVVPHGSGYVLAAERPG